MLYFRKHWKRFRAWNNVFNGQKKKQNTYEQTFVKYLSGPEKMLALNI